MIGFWRQVETSISDVQIELPVLVILNPIRVEWCILNVALLILCIRLQVIKRNVGKILVVAKSRRTRSHGTNGVVFGAVVLHSILLPTDEVLSAGVLLNSSFGLLNPLLGA